MQAVSIHNKKYVRAVDRYEQSYFTWKLYAETLCRNRILDTIRAYPWYTHGVDSLKPPPALIAPSVVNCEASDSNGPRCAHSTCCEYDQTQDS
jgi:hypothetical protein